MPDTPNAKPASKAPAISRAVAILRLLGKSNAPLGVQSIARELGLVPSTCLYVLRALVNEGLVSFNADTKRYALDAGVLTLARQWLSRDGFTDFAQPVLDRLCTQFGVTMLAVQLVQQEHMIVVALAQSEQIVQLSAQVGNRFPALISATGRCMAAFGNYSEAELERGFDKLRWDAAPEYAEWRADVEKAKTQAYAIDQGHYISGVTVVAAPILSHNDAPTHALVAIGIGDAMQKANADLVGIALRGAAQTLASQMHMGEAS